MCRDKENSCAGAEGELNDFSELFSTLQSPDITLVSMEAMVTDLRWFIVSDL